MTALSTPAAPSQPASPARVLIVDDDPEVRSILERNLANSAVECELCSTAVEAHHRLMDRRYSVIISDIRMPEMSGVELLRFAQKNHPDTSVIMVTGVNDMDTALESLRTGACDYITKPFDLLQVRRSLSQAIERNHLLAENRCYQTELEQKVRERTSDLDRTLEEVEGSYRATLEALVTALDAREHETQAHSQRVRAYSEALAGELGVTGEEMVAIGRGALLHDVGKIGVPDSILLKPGRLTPEEWVVMRRHSQMGYDILREIRFLAPAAAIVLAHQERWDGQGYPYGLSGTGIPLGARIFAIADTLDAMTSDRPYRKALTLEQALDEVRRCAGTQFDPAIAEAFLSIRPDTWTMIHDTVNSTHQNVDRLGLLCPT